MPSNKHNTQTTTLTRRAALTLGGMFLLTACGSAATEQKRPEGSASPTGSATGSPAGTAEATASATPSATPSPTLTPALPEAEQEQLRNALTALFADGTYPQYSLLVTGMDGNLPSVKAATAPVDLYAANADTARVPASTFKVLTLFALNHYANLQARLRTRVTRDAAGLYLMAGGDTLLGAGASNPKQIVGRAGLGTLAELTVKALNEGEKPAAALPVYLDGTFFSGPGVSPGWDAADVASGQITPIHPIALESHTVPGKSTASNPVRPDDAAVAAQQAYVDALNTAGKESGLSFTLAERRTAPAEAVEIAAVESATLLEQAQHMMLESDNALAEVLGRCTAIAAGKEGSGEAAQQTVRQALVDAGVNVENLVQADVCGMSLTDRVTARTLVQVIALMNADEHAEQLMSTFPVAGVSGTLTDRFGAANAVHARTFVQAKTGTLYTVSSLCGVATRPDGTRLIFAIILNDLGGSDALPAAKERVDAAAAAIANHSTAPSASSASSASSAPEASVDATTEAAKAP
ncbi:D-alanyl-D-alanine carboxypeptidase/D-alanyl-D-alanine-endopeptidase [uncultured Rothia sp.]|uniref:D-alanyl-D-alanine carboxypeptidase/D-alanyl-D-alanine endopeptidase n=1 Tax=uncultured Rothia sp. TaxID=316088 RepID=UPI0028E38F10|nr:D-alanyl-D-alanine carboxypeptidase/D-alanyl-D-alanine-endopeptidase [uncultured Rothia sp.]